MKKSKYIIGFILSVGAFIGITQGAPVAAQTYQYRVVTPIFTCLSNQPCTSPTPTPQPKDLTRADSKPCTQQTGSSKRQDGKNQRYRDERNNRMNFWEFILQILIRLLERAGIPVPPSVSNPCITNPGGSQPISRPYPGTTGSPMVSQPIVSQPISSTPRTTTAPVSTVAPGVTSQPTGVQPTTSAGPITASCTPAGIAALSDQLVTELRKACTSEGTGIISRNNYTCMKATLEKILPNGSAAYQQAYQEMFQFQHNYYQCVNFTATVTKAACGQRISAPSPGNAKDYSGHSPSGYKWMNKTSGAIQVGDIPVYTGGQFGHIMVVAEVLDANHVRIAEANQASEGEVSNTRIETVDNSVMTGWIRKL